MCDACLVEREMSWHVYMRVAEHQYRALERFHNLAIFYLQPKSMKIKGAHCAL